LVEVELGNRRRITVQVRADVPVNINDQVGVSFEARGVHLFDAVSGKSLLK
jgi:hypothetical protein